MSLNLSKGSTLNLNKVQGLNLNKGVVFGLGFSGKGGRSIDLDSYVAVLDANGTPIDFVYFSKLKGKGIKHNGDDRQGGGRATDPNETIDINLDNLDSRAQKLVIGLFIYAGAASLKGVKSAFTNLTDNSGNEVCRYDLKEKFGNYKSVEVATVTKESTGEWTFKATGAGSSDGYSDIKNKFTGRRSYSSSSSSTSSGSGGFFGWLRDLF